ncbi:MAG TPA: hypothetical protein VFS70_15615 [Actinomycetota bacterium]|nr:hypothetical protein [Actinomycetota bacterium]
MPCSWGTFLPGEVILPLTGVAAATTGGGAWPVAAAVRELTGAAPPPGATYATFDR